MNGGYFGDRSPACAERGGQMRGCFLFVPALGFLMSMSMLYQPQHMLSSVEELRQVSPLATVFC